MESNIPCDLCGGTKTKIFLNLPGPPFGLVQCLNCGLVYLDPRPSPSEIGKYYSTDYYTSQAPEIAEQGLREQIKRLAYQARGQTHDGNLLARAKWKFLELALGWRAARGVPPRQHGRLLDVGCGNGEYAAWIRDNVPDWQTEGVEFNEHAAVQARRAFGLTVHTGNLTELNLPAAHYDMLSFWHSLEHVYTPSATIAEAHRLLRPGGVIAIEIPNIASWEARHTGAKWYHLAVPFHLYHFTPATLTRLLTSQGFRILSIQHPHSRYTLMQAIRTGALKVPPSLKPLALIAARRLALTNAPFMRVYAVKN